MTKLKKKPVKGRVLNARPDAIDFRDKIYSATLIEVPEERSLEEYKKYKVPILDQGMEGACTGFGLATMIHYLLRIKKVRSEETVSPRMLYEMAKKYDEWEGEDYVGSSARGAIKGWHKHGVCAQKLWPYDQDNPDKQLTPDRIENAARFPLGAYYRVNHKDIVDIHTALTEVGILFATCRVHEGWFDVSSKNGSIPYKGQEIVGAHAFSIVAYDQNGLWIQNSWGNTWGKDGFGLISYDDWLANGTDIWVARMGVPITLKSPNSIAKSFSVAASVKDGLSFKDLRPHVISLGNNGELKTAGTYGNVDADVKQIFEKHIPELTKHWTNKRILLYAHGGLVSENSVLQRLADYRQTLLAKEIYPIFFVWNTDLWTTVKNLLQDAVNKRKPEERVSSIFDFMLDRLDDALEPLLRMPGKTFWKEMKQNAFSASSPQGGATIAMDALKEFVHENRDTSIHLLGHSAGSIFLAPMLNYFTDQKLLVSSCSLWAPACTMDCFDNYYASAIESGLVNSLNLFTLTEDSEQDDSCMNIYNKSLLYLVSNSFETTPRGTPILGMANFVQAHERLQKLISDNKVSWITSPNNLSGPDACHSSQHGDFDNDVDCFLSTVTRILKADPQIKKGDLGEVSDSMPVDGAEAGLRAGHVEGAAGVSNRKPIQPAPFEPQLKPHRTIKDFSRQRQALNDLK